MFSTLNTSCIVSVFVVWSHQAALSVEELTARYDNEADCTNTDEDAPHGDKEEALFSKDGFGFNCTVTLTVEEDMNQPIYFYYQLHNFYQNHRRLVKLVWPTIGSIIGTIMFVNTHTHSLFPSTRGTDALLVLFLLSQCCNASS